MFPQETRVESPKSGTRCVSARHSCFYRTRHLLHCLIAHFPARWFLRPRLAQRFFLSRFALIVLGSDISTFGPKELVLDCDLAGLPAACPLDLRRHDCDDVAPLMNEPLTLSSQKNEPPQLADTCDQSFGDFACTLIRSALQRLSCNCALRWLVRRRSCIGTVCTDVANRLSGA